MGSHTYKLEYAGDGPHMQADSPEFVVDVVAAKTHAVLRSSSSHVNTGSNITLTASLVGADGGVPTGNVTIMDGSSVAGTATLDNTGHAVLVLSETGPGKHSYTAVYPGEGNYLGSHSMKKSVKVKQVITGLTAMAAAIFPSG